jgi:hypothetical protein
LFDETSEYSTGFCSVQPGKRGGLDVSFSETDLAGIPYGVSVEVFFTVIATGPCVEYNDIIVQLISTCEIPSATSQKHQYRSALNSSGEVVILFHAEEYPFNDTSTFSVSWKSPERKLSDGGLVTQGNPSAQDKSVFLELKLTREDLLVLGVVIVLLWSAQNVWISYSAERKRREHLVRMSV